jgi:chromosome segregation ATPase
VKAKLEKLESNYKIEELEKRVLKLQTELKNKSLEHTEQFSKFRTLAENLQKKHGVMIEEVKKKNKIISDREEQIHEMGVNMSQYKDILNDSQQTLDLEEEFEETKLKLTEQIIENQKQHSKEMESAKGKLKSVKSELKSSKNELESAIAELKSSKAEIESVKADLEKAKAEIESAKAELNIKLQKVEATLKVEREAFKQQLEHMPDTGCSDELISLQTQLKENQKLVKIEQSKAFSYSNMIEQMQNQLDQADRDLENAKK